MWSTFGSTRAGFNKLHLRSQNNKAYTLKPGQITKLQFSKTGGLRFLVILKIFFGGGLF
jgi:hypothetical protein